MRISLIGGVDRWRDQRMRLRDGGAAAPIGPRDDLQEVAVWIVEVYSATVIPSIDLVTLAAKRVCPIWQPLLADPPEDLVELGFTHPKSVVLLPDFGVGLR